ncbi:MAG: hypothetical protein P1U74_02605 [Legionellaceae bacterium]|nr:hypothetical protein [Legionellaceae bacterium]
MPNVNYKQAFTFMLVNIGKDLSEACLNKITAEVDKISSGGYTRLSQGEKNSIDQIQKQAKENDLDATDTFNSMHTDSDDNNLNF